MSRSLRKIIGKYTFMRKCVNFKVETVRRRYRSEQTLSYVCEAYNAEHRRKSRLQSVEKCMFSRNDTQVVPYGPGRPGDKKTLENTHSHGTTHRHTSISGRGGIGRCDRFYTLHRRSTIEKQNGKPSSCQDYY